MGLYALEGELAALPLVCLTALLWLAAAATALRCLVMHRLLAGYGPGAGLGFDCHYAHTLTGA